MKRQNSEKEAELRETCGKRSLHGDCDEFRRQTRLQARNEKQLKAFSSSVEISIETLHSICASTVLKQAKKRLQKQHSNKSKRRATYPTSKSLTARYDLRLFNTAQGHTPKENRLQAERVSNETETKKSLNSSNIAGSLSLENSRVEVFVEVHGGIDLVVDLDSNNIEDWLLERISSLLMHPDVADESLQQCHRDLTPTDHPIAPSFASSNTEAPSTNAIGCDAGSQSAPMEILGGCLSCGKISEVMDSQESFNTEVKNRSNQGIDFAFLARMPTFFAKAVRRSEEESKATCSIDCMVACIRA